MTKLKEVDTIISKYKNRIHEHRISEIPYSPENELQMLEKEMDQLKTRYKRESELLVDQSLNEQIKDQDIKILMDRVKTFNEYVTDRCNKSTQSFMDLQKQSYIHFLLKQRQ